MRNNRTEAERYRDAAVEALDQLNWVIDYLYRIRKRELADALKRNAADIAKRLP